MRRRRNGDAAAASGGVRQSETESEMSCRSACTGGMRRRKQLSLAKGESSAAG
jgi:hypothetical protein